MATEKFRECLVAKERSGKDRAIEWILLGWGILFCIFGVLLTPLAFAIAAVCVALWYIRINFYRVEYEYTLMEDRLTVDIIYNQKRRKRKGEYELKKVQAAADTKDERLEHLRNRKPQILDYTSHADGARDLSLFIQDEEHFVELRLSPDETTKKMILKQVPALARRLEMI